MFQCGYQSIFGFDVLSFAHVVYVCCALLVDLRENCTKRN